MGCQLGFLLSLADGVETLFEVGDFLTGDFHGLVSGHLCQAGHDVLFCLDFIFGLAGRGFVGRRVHGGFGLFGLHGCHSLCCLECLVGHLGLGGFFVESGFAGGCGFSLCEVDASVGDGLRFKGLRRGGGGGGNLGLCGLGVKITRFHKK